MARFTPDYATGDFPSFAELAERFGRQKSVIQQAVSAALREGLVNVRVSAAPPIAKRELEIEEQLKQQFRIRQPLVFEGNFEDDSDLHRQLGWMMGRYLEKIAEEIFEPKGLVVVSGGRAVHFTVTALRDVAPAVRWPKVAIGSLTGSVGDKPVIHPLEKRVTMLDGDAQASWLCCCFGNGTQLHVVAHSLAVQQSDAARTLGHSWLHEDWRAPGVAIVGLGALHEGHRLFRHIHDRMDQERSLGFLIPIAQGLDKLFAITKQYTTGRYSPVADLCQRFFLVNPPPDVQMDPRDRDRAERLISEINSCLITVSFDHLAEAHRLYVVAGGALKSRALYHLLTAPVGQTAFRVHGLATDRATAEQLLHWAQSEEPVRRRAALRAAGE